MLVGAARLLYPPGDSRACLVGRNAVELERDHHTHGRDRVGAFIVVEIVRSGHVLSDSAGSQAQAKQTPACGDEWGGWRPGRETRFHVGDYLGPVSFGDR